LRHGTGRDADDRQGNGGRRGNAAALADLENGMSATVVSDPVLVRYRKALGEIYGKRLERAVLYGSRARGDARPDSDYDVAVFLHDMNELGPELHRLATLEVAIIDATGEVVHAMPYRAGTYNELSPLMHEIQAEGIDL
jgi:predicted nucleotidyltransferase